MNGFVSVDDVCHRGLSRRGLQVQYSPLVESPLSVCKNRYPFLLPNVNVTRADPCAATISNNF